VPCDWSSPRVLGIWYTPRRGHWNVTRFRSHLPTAPPLCPPFKPAYAVPFNALSPGLASSCRSRGGDGVPRASRRPFLPAQRSASCSTGSRYTRRFSSGFCGPGSLCTTHTLSKNCLWRGGVSCYCKEEPHSFYLTRRPKTRNGRPPHHVCAPGVRRPTCTRSARTPPATPSRRFRTSCSSRSPSAASSTGSPASPPPPASSSSTGETSSFRRNIPFAGIFCHSRVHARL